MLGCECSIRLRIARPVLNGENRDGYVGVETHEQFWVTGGGIPNAGLDRTATFVYTRIDIRPQYSIRSRKSVFVESVKACIVVRNDARSGAPTQTPPRQPALCSHA